MNVQATKVIFNILPGNSIRKHLPQSINDHGLLAATQLCSGFNLRPSSHKVQLPSSGSTGVNVSGSAGPGPAAPGLTVHPAPGLTVHTHTHSEAGCRRDGDTVI
eukprot:753557-Hanusia_phi.AAC.1